MDQLTGLYIIALILSIVFYILLKNKWNTMSKTRQGTKIVRILTDEMFYFQLANFASVLLISLFENFLHGKLRLLAKIFICVLLLSQFVNIWIFFIYGFTFATITDVDKEDPIEIDKPTRIYFFVFLAASIVMLLLNSTFAVSLLDLLEEEHVPVQHNDGQQGVQLMAMHQQQFDNAPIHAPPNTPNSPNSPHSQNSQNSPNLPRSPNATDSPNVPPLQ